MTEMFAINTVPPACSLQLDSNFRFLHNASKAITDHDEDSDPAADRMTVAYLT